MLTDRYMPDAPAAGVEQFKDANPANSANPSQQRGLASANSAANKVRTLEFEPQEQTWDAVIPPPEPSLEMFYGVLGRFARQAANGTEINPVAAMAAAMAWLSASMGRNPAIAVGDGWHHLRLFTLHVGRSSRGGKGMAIELLTRIFHEISNIDGVIAPKLHTGGLSTREGLALLIHDGYRDGANHIPPINDKRLFIVESEFANVLAQGKRDGNTLSTCLRDSWDGMDIRPATKSSRVWASQPHIALHGNITPTELRTKMSTGDLTNGFANRFLIFWAERTGVIPFPSRTPDTIVKAFAIEFAKIIQYGLAGYPVNSGSKLLSLRRQAVGLYSDIYRDYAKPHPAGELISGLLQRRAPMLLRIAGLFAVTDQTSEISRDHMEAACAWMNYYAQSVHMIFGPTTDPEGEAHRNEDAERLHAWLTNAGDWRSRKSITSDCFKGHKSKVTIDEALERLALERRIERREVNSGGITKRTDYRATELPNKDSWQEFAPSSHKTSLSQTLAVTESSQSSQVSQSPAGEPESGAFDDCVEGTL